MANNVLSSPKESDLSQAASQAQKLTIAEFLVAYSGREEKFELVDGVPVMMAGANRRHVRIMANLGPVEIHLELMTAPAR